MSTSPIILYGAQFPIVTVYSAPFPDEPQRPRQPDIPQGPTEAEMRQVLQVPLLRRAERQPPQHAGEALRSIRLLAGMTLRQAADALGISVVQLSEWELGPGHAAARKRMRLAHQAIMDSLSEEQRSEVETLRKLGEEARMDTLDPPDTPNLTGTIVCPNCKGKLHFSISGDSGHMHMLCETPNCVSCME